MYVHGLWRPASICTEYIAWSIGTQAAPWSHAIDASISRGLIAFWRRPSPGTTAAGMPRRSIATHADRMRENRDGGEGRSARLRGVMKQNDSGQSGCRLCYINTAIRRSSSSSSSSGGCAGTLAVLGLCFGAFAFDSRSRVKTALLCHVRNLNKLTVYGGQWLKWKSRGGGTVIYSFGPCPLLRTLSC